MGDVVKLNCLTTLPIEPDEVLEGAKGKLETVLLLGWDQNGELYAAASSGDLREALLLATKFVHKLHAGDYG